MIVVVRILLHTCVLQMHGFGVMSRCCAWEGHVSCDTIAEVALFLVDW